MFFLLYFPQFFCKITPTNVLEFFFPVCALTFSETNLILNIQWFYLYSRGVTLCHILSLNMLIYSLYNCRIFFREGKSNAHLNGDYQRIGDIMLNNMKVLQLYRSFIEHHEDILAEMETSCRRNKRFETVYMEFEGQKVCYLPLYTFLLKPAQRLLHYKV